MINLFAGIDFETFSVVDLPNKGLDNYVNDPSFTAECAAIATAHGVDDYDFILDQTAKARFIHDVKSLIERDYILVAHNAGFERAVFKIWGGLHIDDKIIDSAVYARMLGAGEKLEVASRQLTGAHKLAVGVSLIQLFSIPNAENKGMVPDKWMLMHHQEEWIQYKEYCGVDAQGSREIAIFADKLMNNFQAPDLLTREDEMELVTYQMNCNGWPIDRPLIEKMSQRAWANSVIEQKAFFLDTDTQLNFNSPKQMKDYCTARGVTVGSLDKYQLPLVLEKVQKELVVQRAMNTATKHALQDINVKRQQDLEEVEAMLLCKQELGGSSLSKLNKILELAGADDILRDQYVHNGAGQTFRTSGRGVQMQNLKKLGGNIRDMETVYDYEVEWTNTDMAEQLRQVFIASHADGELMVGDFSAVESRGLAYLAGEEWKLDAYRQGLDVYKVLVTRFEGFEGRTVDSITAEERPRGKYSELSCGYQASGKAVQEFMFRLGFVITESEGAQNVKDWRKANPAILQFWRDLDEALRDVVTMGQPGRGVEFYTSHGLKIRIMGFLVDSIQAIHPGAMSLMIQIFDGKEALVTRVLHGAYFEGRSICYYKPEERLSAGVLWSNVNKTATQKSKPHREILLSVYGGKLAGILTQSLCRELFFDSMALLAEAIKHFPNVRMVGQFHDEIVLDWWPQEGEISKDALKDVMAACMSKSKLRDFPLIADIKSARRYIK